MKNEGFMPFSAAGALMLLLVLGLVGEAAWLRHQRSLDIADDICISSLTTKGSEVLGDIQNSARYAIYRALWEVCKKASEYVDNERERAIESLASTYFRDRVAELAPTYSNHDARIELDVPKDGIWPELNLKEIEGGYVLASAGLPDGSRIKLTAWDGSASLALPFDNFELFVDSRYFLLQRQMEEFMKKLGDVIFKWQAMEFAKAWAGAWLAGKVELSSSHTRAFFETAWDSHELDLFGSCDYLASAQSLFPKLSGIKNLLNHDFKSSLEGIRIPIDSAINVIENEDDDNFASLKAVLNGTKNSLDEASNLLQIELPKNRTPMSEMNELNKVGKEAPEFKIDREKFYELLPPPPVRSVPGLSVYHDLKVKNVSYRREDLAGLFGSPTATPIPLPFHGVTLWWGQFSITVELENWPVVEIFDFDNPTLPMIHESVLAHKPLAYRWEVGEKSFRISVTVLSLKAFNVIPVTSPSASTP